MAISAGMVWQVQNGGNDANGGGFRGGAAVSTPSAPSVSATSGGSVAVADYWVVVTISDGNGETPKSGETKVTTTSSNKTITVTAPTDPNVTGATWNVYVATATGGPYWSQSTGNAFGSNKAVTSTPPTSGTQAPGVDYSLASGPQVTIDNSTVTCTTPGANSNTLTFTAGYTPTAADVGNVVHLTAGTNIRAGWYEITAWTATTWTLTGGGNATTAGGAGAAVTGNMGGAFATPGGLGAAISSDSTNGNTSYIKYHATPYTCSGTANVSGGRLSTPSVVNGVQFVTGYDTTRTRGNTDANRPVLDAGAASMTVVQTQANTATVRQLSVTNSAARASVTGIAYSGFCESCKADSCATGFSNGGGNPGLCQDCLANACTNGFSGSGAAHVRCVSTATVTNGFTFNNNGQLFLDCVSVGSATSTFGFIGPAFFVNCVARDHKGTNADGFQGGSAIGVFENCISYNNTRYGYNPNGTGANMRLWSCAAGGNGTADVAPTGWVGSYQLRNFVALTADPHTNASGGDLSLNATAGGGAACKAAGLPGSATTTKLPGLSTNAYPDLGPAQSQASAGGPAYFAY